MNAPRVSAWAQFEGHPSAIALFEPDEVIIASSLCDVITALCRVEDAVRAGGTAIGMLSYEASPAFDAAMTVRPREESDFPLLHFSVCYPRSGGRLTACGWETAAAIGSQSVGAARSSQKGESESVSRFTASEWTPDISREEYNQCISAVHGAIREGNSYQVNYTLRLTSHFSGDHSAFFSNLLRTQRCGYGAYLDVGRFRVYSASPELFFRWSEGDGRITTRPMKGTAPRGFSAQEDEHLREALAACTKNRAENLMIVDLLRNDLGRVALSGTVKVPALFDVEPYPTVLQMTSTVTAETRPGTRLVDVFRALFPCGSITGAPKVSTMRLISRLEGSPRDVYCGAICVITPEAAGATLPSAESRSLATSSESSGSLPSSPHSLRVVASVPIRTVVLDTHTGKATYGVGGGITWDSTAEGEYDEVLAKAQVLRVASGHASETRENSAEGRAVELASDVRRASCSLGEAMRGPEFTLLETLRLEYDLYMGGDELALHHFTLLERHMGRLRASARFFNYQFHPDTVAEALARHAATHGSESRGPRRVRLMLARDGTPKVESAPMGLAPPVPLPPHAAAAMASCDPSWGAAYGTRGGVFNAPAPPPLVCVVSSSPVSVKNVFLYHKTTRRDVYQAHADGVRTELQQLRARCEAAQHCLDEAEVVACGSHSHTACPSPSTQHEVLLWCYAGACDDVPCASEFTIGNVVAEVPREDGHQGWHLVTPPVCHACLPGCLRAAMVAAGAIAEAPLPLTTLRRARAVWLLNSVRGWVPVQLDWRLLERAV